MTGSKPASSPAWGGRRVLVTGGCGFIGARAVRQLVEAGAEVRVVSLPNESNARIADLGTGVELVEEDLSAAEVPERLVEDVDIVLHFASRGVVWNPSETLDELFATNTLATYRLVLAAGRAGVTKVVLAGSVFEYGKGQARDHSRRLGREDAQRPISLYGVTKAAASGLAPIAGDEASVETTSLRIFSPFGPGEDRRRFVPHVLSTALQGAPIRMTAGAQVRDFCFVDDIARAFIVEGQRRRGRHTDWNLGTGRGLSLLEAAETLVGLVGGRSEIIAGALPYREGEAFHLVAEATELPGELRACLSTSFEEGGQQTANWLQKTEGLSP
jgi:nucleoside-diphosphate-sugar epimerase